MDHDMPGDISAGLAGLYAKPSEMEKVYWEEPLSKVFGSDTWKYVPVLLALQPTHAFLLGRIEI
jgi:hypothetical protein